MSGRAFEEWEDEIFGLKRFDVAEWVVGRVCNVVIECAEADEPVAQLWTDDSGCGIGFHESGRVAWVCFHQSWKDRHEIGSKFATVRLDDNDDDLGRWMLGQVIQKRKTLRLVEDRDE